jgi:7-carboxy-7-deazaguanine synthase
MIAANPTEKRIVEGDNVLHVAEFFCDTIQGENFVGSPSTFLRLQGCTLNCDWCDTKEVWRFGNPYTYAELISIMEQHDVINKMRQGQHLVITGGSPLRQQKGIVGFLKLFIQTFHFQPYLEIENECTIMPNAYMNGHVDCWNNSPKLSMSGNKKEFRYKPEVLKALSKRPNSWFKFVVKDESDWKEILEDFLIPELITKDQIVLMPLGATRDELCENRERVVRMAIKHNVRYSTREHIILWDKKTGI